MSTKPPETPAREEPAAEWVAVESLKPWDENPRKNDKAVAKVARSIKRFGFGAPVLARKADREVIAGHTRLKAALKLRLAEVPVRFLDLDEEAAHKLAVADNRTAQESAWDRELLSEHVQGWEDDPDIAALGFSDDELEKLLGDPSQASDIEEIDCSDTRAQFWLAVDGPLPQQPEVLERLKQALGELDGVNVTLSTSEL